MKTCILLLAILLVGTVGLSSLIVERKNEQIAALQKEINWILSVTARPSPMEEEAILQRLQETTKVLIKRNAELSKLRRFIKLKGLELPED